MISKFPAPRFFAASTKSLSFNDIVSARTILATPIHEKNSNDNNHCKNTWGQKGVNNDNK